MKHFVLVIIYVLLHNYDCVTWFISEHLLFMYALHVWYVFDVSVDINYWPSLSLLFFVLFTDKRFFSHHLFLKSCKINFFFINKITKVVDKNLKSNLEACQINHFCDKNLYRASHAPWMWMFVHTLYWVSWWKNLLKYFNII